MQKSGLLFINLIRSPHTWSLYYRYSWVFRSHRYYILGQSRLRGSESRWFGYLQSLPDKTVDIAILWGAPIANLERCVCLDTCPMTGDHEDSDTCDISISSTCSHCARMHDGRNAKAWLEATEAEQELRGLLVSRSFDGSSSMLCIHPP